MHFQSDFDQHNITQHCMNGEAGNSRFVIIYALGDQRLKNQLLQGFMNHNLCCHFCFVNLCLAL